MTSNLRQTEVTTLAVINLIQPNISAFKDFILYLEEYNALFLQEATCMKKKHIKDHIIFDRKGNNMFKKPATIALTLILCFLWSYNAHAKDKDKLTDATYQGVSIAETGGKTVPPVLEDKEPKDMKRVEAGEIMKSRSVKDVVVYTDSKELKDLEEKRLKRKENLKKELEEKRKAQGIIK